MKKLLVIAAAAALMTACASAPSQSSNMAAADAAIAAANQANHKAKKVNYEWRDTGKLIKKADKAKDKGEFDSAVKLANKAKRQAMNAYAQYEDQKNAQPRY